MRILAAALGALLISTSQPALALGGHEQDDLQQTEAQQLEPQQAQAPAAETQPAEVTQPDMQQAETQPAEAPHQPQMRQAAAPQVEALQRDFAAVALAGLPRDVKWTVFVEPTYGTRLDVPGAVFAMPDGPANRGMGRQFKRPDGRASLAVYSQRNDARDTPASYLRKNLQSPRASLDYERVTPEFFAISAIMGDSIYYSRCNFSHNAGRAIHCFDLKYPAQEKQSWDGIVTRMSRSLRPLNGG
jgi:hypothetical protein